MLRLELYARIAAGTLVIFKGGVYPSSRVFSLVFFFHGLVDEKPDTKKHPSFLS